VYRYVTWYDSPQDGTGASDAADGNGDGSPDGNGQDAKRVTVVVAWRNVITGDPSSLSESSLFSDGKITNKAPAKNNPPVVSCPGASISGMTVTFTGVASDSDGTISNYTWTFGDSGTATGSPVSHTYTATGTYNVVTTAVDNGGASSSNSAAGCNVTVTDPGAGNGGPDGTVKINGNATYTNAVGPSHTVTLSIAKTSGASPVTVKISNDGSTWVTYAYATSQSWDMGGSDGTRTVYLRLYSNTGAYGAIATDTIILDTTAPGAPTGFQKTSSTTQGANLTAVFAWTAPVGVSDLGGYRVYTRLITSTGAWTLVCDTSATTCSDTHKKTDTYEYYVVAYDLATNVSVQSATPNPTA
jgi:hypothetical protein